MKADASRLTVMAMHWPRWQERFMSYRLWHALHNPPATHSYFRREVLSTFSGRLIRRSTWTGMLIRAVLLLADYSPILLFFLMPPLLIISGLTYGLEIAVRLSHRIALAREHNMFDSLATTPAGPLGASWVMCTSDLYRDRQFEQYNSIVRASLLIGFAGVSLLSLLSLMCQSDILIHLGEPIMPALSHYLSLALALIAIYLEFIQTTVWACLLAMLVPTYNRSHIDAPLFTAGLFLLGQITVYLITFVAGFVAMPLLFDRIVFYGPLAESLLAAVRLVIFGLAHEMVIELAWRALILCLNGRTSEVASMLRPVLDD